MGACLSKHHYLWHTAIGFAYLTSLKNTFFEEILRVYEGTPMMYKSIERLNGDSNRLKRPVEVYVSSVFAYLALRQAALTLHHPNDLGKEKCASIE